MPRFVCSQSCNSFGRERREEGYKGDEDEEEEEEGGYGFDDRRTALCWTSSNSGERQMGFVVSQGDVAAINDKVRKHRRLTEAE